MSISRTTFTWGVPAPKEDGVTENHVMYVWYDALSNYLSGLKDITLEWNEKTQSVQIKGDRATSMWPVVHHMIGKDIIWFHCVIWPCMLKSVGIEPPQW